MESQELITLSALAELESAIEEAFATGAHDHLRVLGYGEISSVIAWPGVTGQVACKRLPVFSDRARFEAYERCLHEYLVRLRQGGVDVVETRVYALDAARGQVVGYCVQPVLEADTLGPDVLARASEADALVFFDAVLDHVLACVAPGVGLDGQLSNWALAPGTGPDTGPGTGPDTGRLTYLDVSTPLMRDEAGRHMLDQDLFLSSLPWLMRGVVKRFMLRDILARYFDPRLIVLDFLANLHKEKLAHHLPALLARANERGAQAFASGGAISEREIARYYREDARTWSLLQRLRRMDRAWQHKVRRRAYPFLLPGPIER